MLKSGHQWVWRSDAGTWADREREALQVEGQQAGGRAGGSQRGERGGQWVPASPLVPWPRTHPCRSSLAQGAGLTPGVPGGAQFSHPVRTDV